MSQHKRIRKYPAKKYTEKSPEWRLEQIQYHIRQSLRQDHMLCDMFGLKETDLTAKLRQCKKASSDYLYALEEMRETFQTDSQETLIEIE